MEWGCVRFWNFGLEYHSVGKIKLDIMECWRIELLKELQKVEVLLVKFQGEAKPLSELFKWCFELSTCGSVQLGLNYQYLCKRHQNHRMKHYFPGIIDAVQPGLENHLWVTGDENNLGEIFREYFPRFSKQKLCSRGGQCCFYFCKMSFVMCKSRLCG